MNTEKIPEKIVTSLPPTSSPSRRGRRIRRGGRQSMLHSCRYTWQSEPSLRPHDEYHHIRSTPKETARFSSLSPRALSNQKPADEPQSLFEQSPSAPSNEMILTISSLDLDDDSTTELKDYDGPRISNRRSKGDSRVRSERSNKRYSLGADLSIYDESTDELKDYDGPRISHRRSSGGNRIRSAIPNKRHSWDADFSPRTRRKKLNSLKAPDLEDVKEKEEEEDEDQVGVPLGNLKDESTGKTKTKNDEHYDSIISDALQLLDIQSNPVHQESGDSSLNRSSDDSMKNLNETNATSVAASRLPSSARQKKRLSRKWHPVNVSCA